MSTHRQLPDSDELRYYCRQCEVCYPSRVYRARARRCPLHPGQPLIDAQARPEAVGPVTSPLEDCADSLPAARLRLAILTCVCFIVLVGIRAACELGVEWIIERAFAM